MYGIPLPILQTIITSRHFTELRAYRARWTWRRDLWFSQFAAGYTAAGHPPDRFIPIDGDDEEEDRRRRAARAERRLDREAE